MKSYAKNFLSLFLKGLLAGVILAVGITAYIATKGAVSGLLLLAISFCMVFAFEFPTYTAKACSLIDGKFSGIFDLIAVALGNLVSIYCFAKLLLMTGKGANYRAAAYTFSMTRLNDTIPSLIISSILCGTVIAVAIYAFNRFKDNHLLGYAFLIAAVCMFVLGRLEHSIITTYCFTLSRVWSLNVVCRFLCIALGNAIGGIVTSVLLKLAIKTDKAENDV